LIVSFVACVKAVICLWESRVQNLCLCHKCHFLSEYFRQK